jgi:hypothetical protein
MARERVLGLILVGLGGVLLVVLTTEAGGEIVVAAIGLGFLLAFAVTGSYGFLVPGGILGGLGTGLIVATAGGPDDAVVLGLGAGFVAIAVIDRLRGHARAGWWWPFIPGGVLLTGGTSALTGVEGRGRYLLPAALIVLGLALFLRAGARGKGSSREADEDHPRSA